MTGRELVLARTACGYSQRDVAAMMRVSVRKLSYIEHSDRVPNGTRILYMLALSKIGQVRALATEETK